MYKRIVFIISVALFAFLAFVAVIVTELHDREFPVALGTKAAADLDFRWTRMSNEEAFRQLGMLSDRLGLGLIRVAPDLEGDPSGQVFVVLGQEPAWTGPVPRFGNQPDGRILGKDALAPSYATGTYLVTGETAHLAEFRAWLAEHRVEQRWGEDTLGTVLEWLVRQSEFGTALLACAAMMVSLALYWLTVKARGRAIRVLAGVSTWRIQYEDLGGFLMVLVAAAVLSNACAVPYVGFVHGWIFVPYYAKVLAIFEIAVIAVTMALALVLAAVSWPSPAMLAAREPAVKTLRNGTAVLRLVKYTLILATIGPAITAFAHAKDAAAEQAMWKALADQVVLSFPLGTTESDFQRLMPHVGQVVQAAESRNAVAFSYAIPGEHLRINRHDIAPYRYLVLVNQRWLDLMLSQGQPRENPGREPAAGFVPLSRGCCEIPVGQ
nr:MAG: hypothetical protein DIU70_10530 [Bacillota bacterium]